MKKNYREISLQPDITINEVVLILMEHAARGEFVCTEFEGHKFYSDTISMNSAYQKVYGKSYYEIMAPDAPGAETISGVEVKDTAETSGEIKATDATEVAEESKSIDTVEVPNESEPIADAKVTDETETELEVEPEIPLSELEMMGRECIHEKYWDAWSKCVALYEGDEEKEKDLMICLTIISAIDETDMQLDDAMKVIKKLNFSKDKLYELLDIVETFGDKGYYLSMKARAPKGFRKTTVSGEDSCSVYIDRDTRCQYLWVKNGNAGGLQLIVNPDGTPKLYEGDVE